MEQRHPDDTTPRVEDLFAAGIAEMQAAPKPAVEKTDPPAEPPAENTPDVKPVNYRGATQAEAPNLMHVEGSRPKAPAPEVNLVARPTGDLADDDDIAW
jgi:hypothetical protein